MTKKWPKLEPSEPSDGDAPMWVNDETPERTTPYTEEEIDLLVDGTIESIRDKSTRLDRDRRKARESRDARYQERQVGMIRLDARRP